MRSAAILAAILCLASCSPRRPARAIRVAAAADLAHAFAELGGEFETRTGVHVETEYGSSGLLAKQIEQGAPFALFAAANRDYVDQVIEAGKCDATTAQSYARGRLVVWTRNGVARPEQLADLADPRFKKIAIANPEHAPYGKAAREALQQAQLWARVEPKIVFGENVQATMLYARDGNADAAIVALSLAAVTNGGASLAVDPALHAPLDQAMVVCGTGAAADDAKQLEAFLASREGREVMTRYGFTLPADAPPTTP